MSKKALNSYAEQAQSRRLFAVAALLVVLAGFLALLASAQAATISAPGFTLNAGNSSDFFDNNGSTRGELRTSVGATASDATSFTSGYRALAAVEQNNNGSSTLTLNADYTVSFDVLAASGEAWSFTVESARVGALTLVSDGAGSALASLSALTATVTGAALTGSLGLAAVGPLSGGTGGDLPFNQLATATLSGVGTGATQTVSVQFVFQSSVQSTSVSNGDEAALRMGIADSLNGFTAGAYPGPGARVLAGDGHIFRTTMIVNPEPGTWMLMGTGLLGLALFTQRRRPPARMREA